MKLAIYLDWVTPTTNEQLCFHKTSNSTETTNSRMMMFEVFDVCILLPNISYQLNYPVIISSKSNIILVIGSLLLRVKVGRSVRLNKFHNSWLFNDIIEWDFKRSPLVLSSYTQFKSMSSIIDRIVMFIVGVALHYLANKLMYPVLNTIRRLTRPESRTVSTEVTPCEVGPKQDVMTYYRFCYI